MDKHSRPGFALVLGSGGARGLAHIGILRALDEAGLKPDLIVGVSIGALVGAAYASGKLDALEDWIRPLDHMDILKLLDTGFASGGFINGERLMNAFSGHVGAADIESLSVPFVAIATDIETGREIWLRDGPIVPAVRASIAIPGLFSPVHLDDRWLVDGGLVNPVPVSVARALGAECVLAVNLNGELLGAPGVRRRYARPSTTDGHGDGKPLWTRVQEWWSARGSGLARVQTLFSGSGSEAEEPPGIVSVVADSIDIMQDRITRARLAGEPPDLMMSPALGNFGMLEFDRADEAIDEGHRCAEEYMDQVRAVLGTD